MPKELRNCDVNTEEGLKKLDRWLNSKVSDQLKMKLLWIAAKTKKKNEMIKKYENQNKENLFIKIYKHHWMIIEF